MFQVSHQDAYAGMCAADRKGDFRSALTFSTILIQGFKTGKGVRDFPSDKIPIVMEVDAKSRRLFEEHLKAKGAENGFDPRPPSSPTDRVGP